MRAVLAMVVLAGCVSAPIIPENLDLLAETRRDFAQAVHDAPLSAGPISIVVAERGQMRTYRLAPCGGGTSACAPGGRAVPVTKGTTVWPDYTIVANAYRGRTFFLVPGGQGVMRRNGVEYPLAWE